MTEHQPITGQELEALKAGNEMVAEFTAKTCKYRSERCASHQESLEALGKCWGCGFSTDLARCIAEIERLRAGLERIEARLSLDESQLRLRDGGPIMGSLLIARSTLGHSS